jgi:acetylornithine aminotransferase
MNLFEVYDQYNIEIVEGKGCDVKDQNGVWYLDMYSGHAVVSIGHSHPKYVEAIQKQVAKLGFYSNAVKSHLQEELAEKLGEISGYRDYSLFLVNSGAEANENALKLASFYNGRKKILSFKNSFHGRTSAAVEVTDNKNYRAPINEGIDVFFAELNDIETIRKKLSSREYCAVIIEGVQGVGGIIVPDDQFMKKLRDECTKTDTVLIIDEVQSGNGRTGKFFAHQYADIKGDIITDAKGLGNGFPISGIIISPKFKSVKGQLGTTFGGNQLGCAGAIAVLKEIQKKDKETNKDLIENAKEVGEFLISELKKLSGIKEVRGRGLMIGLEFEQPVTEIRRKLLFEEKVFTGVAGQHTIRLLPPLVLTMDQAKDFLVRLKKCL